VFYGVGGIEMMIMEDENVLEDDDAYYEALFGHSPGGAEENRQVSVTVFCNGTKFDSRN
jgi:hypothetical protein